MKEFYIKSYYAVSYLKSQGIDPLRIEFTPKRYRIFFYPDTEAIRALLNDFYADERLQGYVGACVEVKKMMYDKEGKTNSEDPIRDEKVSQKEP